MMGCVYRFERRWRIVEQANFELNQASCPLTFSDCNFFDINEHAWTMIPIRSSYEMGHRAQNSSKSTTGRLPAVASFRRCSLALWPSLGGRRQNRAWEAPQGQQNLGQVLSPCSKRARSTSSLLDVVPQARRQAGAIKKWLGENACAYQDLQSSLS